MNEPGTLQCLAEGVDGGQGSSYLLGTVVGWPCSSMLGNLSVCFCIHSSVSATAPSASLFHSDSLKILD